MTAFLASFGSGMLELWWNNLILPLQIFYGTGIIAGVALIIEAIMTLTGLGDTEMPDTGFDQGNGVGMLSVRSITGFFFGFGWSGVIAIQNGFTAIPSTVIACAVGFAFLVGIYLLMRLLYSMTAQGNLDYKNAIGQIGTVYVTVPANRGPGGQVEVLTQGRLHTISCLSAQNTPIPPGTKVRVSGLVDQGTLEIEPLSSSR